MSVINNKKDLKTVLGIEKIYITESGRGIYVRNRTMLTQVFNFNSYDDLIKLLKNYAKSKNKKIILSNEFADDLFRDIVLDISTYVRDPIIKKSESIIKYFDWHQAKRPQIVDSILSFVLKNESTINKFKTLCRNIFLDPINQDLCVFYDITHKNLYLSNYVANMILNCFSNTNKKIIESIPAAITKPSGLNTKTIPRITYIDYADSEYDPIRTKKLVKKLINLGHKNILIRQMGTSLAESIYETDEFIIDSIREHSAYYNKVLKNSINIRRIVPEEIEEYFDIYTFMTAFVVWSQPQ